MENTSLNKDLPEQSSASPSAWDERMEDKERVRILTENTKESDPEGSFGVMSLSEALRNTELSASG